MHVHCVFTAVIVTLYVPCTCMCTVMDQRVVVSLLHDIVCAYNVVAAHGIQLSNGLTLLALICLSSQSVMY